MLQHRSDYGDLSFLAQFKLTNQCSLHGHNGGFIWAPGGARTLVKIDVYEIDIKKLCT